MAFVRVEDDTGSIEVVVFPRIFDKTRNYWVDYKPVLVTGKVDSREDNPSLIAEAIDTLETIGEGTKQVFIKVPKNISLSKLRDLKKLLVASQGEHEVVLVFAGNAHKLTLPFKISWDETLAKQISNVLDVGEPSRVE